MSPRSAFQARAMTCEEIVPSICSAVAMKSWTLVSNDIGGPSALGPWLHESFSLSCRQIFMKTRSCWRVRDFVTSGKDWRMFARWTRDMMASDGPQLWGPGEWKGDDACIPVRDEGYICSQRQTEQTGATWLTSIGLLAHRLNANLNMKGYEPCSAGYKPG